MKNWDSEVDLSLLSSESKGLQFQKRLLSPLFSKTVPPVPLDHERRIYPRYTNPLLWILFSWILPVLLVGYKRTLEPNDLFKLNDDIRAETLASKFQVHFDKQLEKDKLRHLARKADARKAAGNLAEVLRQDDLRDYVPAATLCIKALFLTFRLQYTLACLYMSLGLAALTCNPLISKKLITFVELRALGFTSSSGKGVGYAIGVSVMVLAADILVNQGFYFSTITGAQSKGMFTKVLLDKAFRINAESRKKFPASKITSIMSTDVSRIDLGIGFLPWIFCFPVPIGISIGILVHNLSAPAMVGVGIMFSFLFIAGGLGAMLFSFRTSATKLTDARVGYMKEVLNNLKMIKFYSWEIPYFGLISKTRRREMSYLLKMEVTRSVIISIASSLTLVASFAAFMVMYAVKDESQRTPASIFSSVSLFNILAGAFVVLPLAIAGGTDAFIGMKRVGDFLASDELSEEELQETSQDDQLRLEDRKLAIEVANADFEWQTFDVGDEEDEKPKDSEEAKRLKREAKQKKKLEKARKKAVQRGEEEEKIPPSPEAYFDLKGVNLEIRKGEFVVITGPIGSGKTSLLHALNNTMRRTRGTVKRNGSAILCGMPWIQNTTMKGNIVFGKEFVEGWYKKVVTACALDADLEMLPAHDRTEIGERGITLSGGQKARTSLARAVYANADILLLDDVLSAVDSKIGRHIMDSCFLDLMKSKTRVLATHQLSLIESADRVIYLHGDGTIVVGKMAELINSNTGFRELMELNRKQEAEEEEEDDEDEDDQRERGELAKIETELSLRKDDGKLIEEEFKAVNAIKWETYRRYIGTGVQGFTFGWVLPATVMGTILCVFLNLFTNTWLSFWVEYKFAGRGNGFYIALYAVFTALAVIVMTAQFIGIIYIMNRSSRILNIKAAERILHVPMLYMDTTPMGRIINRFTKDTDVLDNEMGDKMAMIAYFSTSICGVLILCIIYLPWFAIAVPFLLFIFVCFTNFYQASGREIKRVEAIQRSHVYNNFNESLTGMETIKTYGVTSNFLSKGVEFTNRMNEAYYLTVTNQRWLDVAFSFLATGFALLISLLCVFRVFKISAASVGLLLSYVLQISGEISMLVVVFTQVEQDMNSAERVIEYVYDIPQEAAFVITETKTKPLWPENGAIKFENVDIAYRPGLPLVLNKFNIDVKPKEKLGICGRTGAGKSSIMVALYRLAELSSGRIEIDGVDTSTLGLNDLRSKLSIIPQDPVLFKGTVRKNLDPFGAKTDDELWDILKRAGIIEKEEFEMAKNQDKSDKELHRFHLDREVEDDGENFSLGEKQLIAFARALVRGCKVLILDEATSSVDYATDSKIQSAIVKEFGDCTILCIAHRLKTIIGYDRVIVMDKGRIVECDTPWNLFSLKKSIFRLMCDKLGLAAADFIRK